MDSSLPTIVLDHNPQRYQENLEIADLQLSGHTHAGQVFPGSIITGLIYDNDYGLLTNQDQSLIVSSGFGSWGYPIRLLTHCEYIEVHVSFKKKFFYGRLLISNNISYEKRGKGYMVIELDSQYENRKEVIEGIVKKIIEEHHIEISEVSFDNLIIHLSYVFLEKLMELIFQQVKVKLII